MNTTFRNKPDGWTKVEAANHRATATRLIKEHDHGVDERDENTRANCGACVLAGLASPHVEEDGNLSPNYAGWQRIYVESGTPVPPEFVKAFGWPLSKAGMARNRPYADALRRSLVTFGCPNRNLRAHLRAETHGPACLICESDKVR